MELRRFDKFVLKKKRKKKKKEYHNHRIRSERESENTVWHLSHKPRDAGNSQTLFLKMWAPQNLQAVTRPHLISCTPQSTRSIRSRYELYFSRWSLLKIGPTLFWTNYYLLEWRKVHNSPPGINTWQ